MVPVVGVVCGRGPTTRPAGVAPRHFGVDLVDCKLNSDRTIPAVFDKMIDRLYREETMNMVVSGSPEPPYQMNHPKYKAIRIP